MPGLELRPSDSKQSKWGKKLYAHVTEGKQPRACQDLNPDRQSRVKNFKGPPRLLQSAKIVVLKIRWMSIPSVRTIYVQQKRFEHGSRGHHATTAKDAPGEVGVG